MTITCETFEGGTFTKIPDLSETINDYFNLDMLVPEIHYINYYFRDPRVCPLARDNWILDMRMIDGALLCFKWPKEMTEEQFVNFLKPLLNKMIGHRH